jgi:Ca2+-binding RTX toxin-like protein
MAVMRRPVGGHVLGFVCLVALGLAPQASAAGSGGFSPTGSMSGPRSGAATAPLPDGRVLFAGGDSGSHDASSYFGGMQSAEIFDPATGTFSPTGSMSEPRISAVPATLSGGRVLVAGGYDAFARTLSTAEIFDPTTGTFSPTGSMTKPFTGSFAAKLPDGRVLLGGLDGNGEIFDPATNTFSSTTIGPTTVPRGGAVTAPLPDGRVLVAGGYYAIYNNERFGPPPSFYDQSSAEIFDPATMTFSSAGVGSMSVSRTGAVAAPLPDGRVLVTGGDDFDIHGNVTPLSSAELFNPVTRKFSSVGVGSMTVPRTAADAAPLPGGRVLVAGGCCDPDAVATAPGSTAALSSAEIFAPVTCKGKQATIVGRYGIHQIGGTRGADVIVAMGGNDLVFGGAGNDLICGTKRDDVINGGAGNDRLYGRAGNDKLNGGKGNDSLVGQAGNDKLKGGPGKDKRVQ